MDSRAPISIIRAQLNDIGAYAAGVVGDVEKITEFFTNNLIGSRRPEKTSTMR